MRPFRAPSYSRGITCPLRLTSLLTSCAGTATIQSFGRSKPVRNGTKPKVIRRGMGKKKPTVVGKPPGGDDVSSSSHVVRTEGFGPSDDLVRGARPHSHLIVESDNLHPHDYDVQRRVLELTMPSLAKVTVGPISRKEDEKEAAVDPKENAPADEGFGVSDVIRHELAQYAWEEQMISVANVITEQVEARMRSLLDSMKLEGSGDQDMRMRIMSATLKEELQSSTEAIRQLVREEASVAESKTGVLVEEITNRLSDRLASHHDSLVQTMHDTSRAHMTESVMITSDLVGGAMARVKDYFNGLETQLKEVVQNATADSQPFLQDQIAAEMRDCLIANIELSAKQQLDSLTATLSSMLSKQNAVLEKAIQSGASQPMAGGQPVPQVDFRPLEDFIEGAVRAGAEELRQSVIDQVSQAIERNASELSAGGDKEQLLLLGRQEDKLVEVSDAMSDVIRSTQELAGAVTAIDEAVHETAKSQKKNDAILKSMKEMVEAQQESLALLQADVAAATTASQAVAMAVASAGPRETTVTPSPAASSDPFPSATPAESSPERFEAHFQGLRQQQNELTQLVIRSIDAVNESESRMGDQLATAVKAMSDHLADVITTTTDASTPPPTTHPSPDTPPSPTGGAPLENTQESIRRLEDDLRQMSSMLAAHSRSFESFKADAHQQTERQLAMEYREPPAVSSPDGSSSPLNVNYVQRVVESAMARQTADISRRISEHTETYTATVAAESVTHEQQLLSFGSSMSALVNTAIDGLRADLALSSTQVNSNSSDSLPPTGGATALTEGRLDQFRTELLSVIREELQGPKDAPALDLVPLYSSIDSALQSIKEDAAKREVDLLSALSDLSSTIVDKIEGLSESRKVADIQKLISNGFKNHTKSLESILDVSYSIESNLKANAAPRRKADDDEEGEEDAKEVGEERHTIDGSIAPTLDRMESTLQQLQSDVAALPKSVSKSLKSSPATEESLKDLHQLTHKSLEEVKGQLSHLSAADRLKEQFEESSRSIVAGTQAAIAAAFSDNAAKQALKEKETEAKPTLTSSDVQDMLLGATERQGKLLSAAVAKLESTAQQNQRELSRVVSDVVEAKGSETRSEIEGLMNAVTDSSSKASDDQKALTNKISSLREAIQGSQAVQKQGIQSVVDLVSREFSVSSEANERQEEHNRETSSALNQVLQVLQNQQTLLTETRAAVKVKPPPTPIAPALHIEAATLAEQAVHSAALDALQANAVQVQDQLNSLMEEVRSGSRRLQESASASPSKKEVDQWMTRLGSVEDGIQQLIEGQRHQEEHLSVLERTAAQKEVEEKHPIPSDDAAPHEAVMAHLSERDELWREEARQAIQTASDSASAAVAAALSEQIAPLRKVLDELLANASCQPVTPPAIPEPTPVSSSAPAAADVTNILSELHSMRERVEDSLKDYSTQMQESASRVETRVSQKVEESLKQVEEGLKQVEAVKDALSGTGDKLTRSEVEESLDTRFNALHESLRSQEAAQRDAIVVPLTTQWESFQSEVVTAVDGVYHSVTETQRSHLTELEGVLEEQLKHSAEALDASVAKGVETLVKAHEVHAAAMSRQLEKRDESQQVPQQRLENAVEKVSQELSTSTAQLMAQLQKQQAHLNDQISVFLSKKEGSQAAVIPQSPKKPTEQPRQESRSTLRHILLYTCQTFLLCMTVFLCAYYLFAAFLIALIPKPLPSRPDATSEEQDLYREAFKTNPVKRVADRVV